MFRYQCLELFCSKYPWIKIFGADRGMQYHRSCGNRGGDTACAYCRVADCGPLNATDHREIVEVIQLRVNAFMTENRGLPGATDYGGNCGPDDWHDGSDNPSHEPSMTHSCESSRAGGCRGRRESRLAGDPAHVN